jgi:hypothetical protein
LSHHPFRWATSSLLAGGTAEFDHFVVGIPAVRFPLSGFNTLLIQFTTGIWLGAVAVVGAWVVGPGSVFFQVTRFTGAIIRFPIAAVRHWTAGRMFFRLIRSRSVDFLSRILFLWVLLGSISFVRPGVRLRSILFLGLVVKPRRIAIMRQVGSVFLFALVVLLVGINIVR